ncbi:MAG: GntR family transcriptional regulator [Candidatus Eisenbacteria bacterium]|nr:GntR family transcriptional regulator [Candidatus Eisenbacteria bacterium]
MPRYLQAGEEDRAFVTIPGSRVELWRFALDIAVSTVYIHRHNMLLHVTTTSETPLYQQIIDQVRALVAAGALAPSAPLPSIRALAADLAISVISVKRAYLELEHLGIIRSQQGRGTFVASPDPGRERSRLDAMVHRGLSVAAIDAGYAGWDAGEFAGAADQAWRSRESLPGPTPPQSTPNEDERS